MAISLGMIYRARHDDVGLFCLAEGSWLSAFVFRLGDDSNYSDNRYNRYNRCNRYNGCNRYFNWGLGMVSEQNGKRAFDFVRFFVPLQNRILTQRF